MPHITYATRLASYRPNSEDRGLILDLEDRLLVLVADGAGGIVNGGAGGVRFGAGFGVIHFGRGNGSTSAMDLDVAYVGKAAGS